MKFCPYNHKFVLSRCFLPCARYKRAKVLFILTMKFILTEFVLMRVFCIRPLQRHTEILPRSPYKPHLARGSNGAGCYFHSILLCAVYLSTHPRNCKYCPDINTNTLYLTVFECKGQPKAPQDAPSVGDPTVGDQLVLVT